MNTLERETVAPETQSAASTLEPITPEEFRDEALSQLVQAWEVPVDDIDVSGRVLESLAGTATDPAQLPGSDVPMLLPAGNPETLWYIFVSQILVHQQDDRMKREEVAIPAEFAVYFDLSQAARAEQVNMFPPLAPEQQERLLQEVTTRGSWFYNVLINANLYLVYHVAQPFLKRGNDSIQIFAAGFQGLDRAVGSYRDHRNVPFNTYVTACIRQALQSDEQARNRELLSTRTAELAVAEADIEENQALREIEARLGMAPPAPTPSSAMDQAPSDTPVPDEFARYLEISRSFPFDDAPGLEQLNDEQLKRIIQARNAGARWAREVMINANLRLIPEAMAEVQDPATDQQALFAAGLRGLERSADYFVSRFPVHLAAHARHNIRQEINDFVAGLPTGTMDNPSEIPAEFAVLLDFETAGRTMLSLEQEKRLAQEIQAKKLWARDVLYKVNLRWVLSTTKQYQNRGVDVQSLHVAGQRGLLRAVKSFDAEQGFRFAVYALQWIRHEMHKLVSEHEAAVTRNPSEWEVDAERQPPAPPYPPTAIGAPAPAPEPEGELRRLLQATALQLQAVNAELSTLRAEVAELRRERAQQQRPPSVPPRPSTARLFPFAPPERAARREP